ncbi:MAG TPA: hypothetical protein VEP90_13905 [Methylomirabilota bacterium]|nr:hypothetical protein [Methylomirabilota bacterium]
MTRSTWLWPAIIIVSALAAGLVNFVIPEAVGRPIIVMWFLFVCPGMVLVRFFRLEEPISQWTIAIALSLSIDALVAGIQMYAGRWFPAGTLGILIGFCLIGAIIQIGKFKTS